MSAFDNIEFSKPEPEPSKTSKYLSYVKHSPIMCGLVSLLLVGVILLLMKPSFVKDDDSSVLYSRIIIYSLIAGIIVAILHHKFY